MKEPLLPKLTKESQSAVLEIVSDGIWDWDANSGYVYRNPAWYLMLGYDLNSFANTVFTWENIIHPDDYARVMEHFDRYITHKSDAYKIQYRCRTSNDDYVWVEDKGLVVEWNEDNTVARMIGAHRDINTEKLLEEKNKLEKLSLQALIDVRTDELNQVNEELRQKMLEVERLVNTDALTLLSSRYFFDKKMTEEKARSRRFNEPLSLIAFDLDNFKPVNDTYGHASGDLVLTKVGDLVLNNIREVDIAARWGGDEFVVLLPNTSVSKAVLLAEKLRELISSQPSIKEFSVTASFGVTQLLDKDDLKGFIKRVDEALYTSKNSGRNQVNSM